MFDVLPHKILERMTFLCFILIMRLSNPVEMPLPLSLHVCILLLVITYQFIVVEASTICVMRRTICSLWAPGQACGPMESSQRREAASRTAGARTPVPAPGLLKAAPRKCLSRKQYVLSLLVREFTSATLQMHSQVLA